MVNVRFNKVAFRRFRVFGLMLSLLTLCSLVLTSCFDSSEHFEISKEINVISREDGSGTRVAFTELFGILYKGEGGVRKDLTTKEAAILKQTDVVMKNISVDKYSIGYISLGSLNDSIKALEIEGVYPSAENVKNGKYPVTRPFNIATKGEPKGLAKDFIEFILSEEGQKVVSEGYISVSDDLPPYSGKTPEGKIVVAGSSSVNPVMEKLKEAYLKINENAVIEIQQSDSSAGMTGAIEGTCDIGMSSRALSDKEKAQLTATPIGIDGITIIVNNHNPLSALTKDDVKKIFMGDFVKWSDVA